MKLYFATEPDTTKSIRNALAEIHLNEEFREVLYDYKEVEEDIIDADENSLLLANNHIHTLNHFKALKSKHRSLGLLLLDSHINARKDSPILEPKNYLKLMFENRLISSQRLILAGIRNFARDEIIFLKENKIRYFLMRDIFMQGIEDFCDTITENVMAWPAFYLSIDLSLLDPVYIPSVENPEPGGLSSRELIYLIQRIQKMKNFVMADITGISSELDLLTTKLTAKLIKELS